MAVDQPPDRRRGDRLERVENGPCGGYASNMKPSDYDLELEDLDRRSTDRLLAAEVFDGAAFAALNDYLSRKAEAIKVEHVISKQVLGSLRNAASAIRNLAPHVPQARENLALADEFEMLLDLMIIGESPQDRVPGVPRII